jgi:hypothetical protein
MDCGRSMRAMETTPAVLLNACEDVAFVGHAQGEPILAVLKGEDG